MERFGAPTNEVTYIQNLSDNNMVKDRMKMKKNEYHGVVGDSYNTFEPQHIPARQNFTVINEDGVYGDNPPSTTTKKSVHDIPCQDISTHVKNCEVCSRLYKCDTTMYIIGLIILGVLCILLIKRFVDS